MKSTIYGIIFGVVFSGMREEKRFTWFTIYLVYPNLYLHMYMGSPDGSKTFSRRL